MDTHLHMLCMDARLRKVCSEIPLQRLEPASAAAGYMILESPQTTVTLLHILRMLYDKAATLHGYSQHYYRIDQLPADCVLSIYMLDGSQREAFVGHFHSLIRSYASAACVLEEELLLYMDSLDSLLLSAHHCLGYPLHNPQIVELLLERLRRMGGDEAVLIRQRLDGLLGSTQVHALLNASGVRDQ